MILVTGASGLLGANLVLTALDRGMPVMAVSNRVPFRHPDAESASLDVRDADAVRAVVARVRPDVVVHTAALTDVDACEGDPALAHAVNAHAPGVLARAAAEAGARLVHVSTDAVFDGQRGGYTEADPTSPVNVYARTKLDGERAVLAASPDHLVVRTTLFGWNAQPKKSLAEWVLGRLDAGERVPGFTDAVFAPLERRRWAACSSTSPASARRAWSTSAAPTPSASTSLRARSPRCLITTPTSSTPR